MCRKIAMGIVLFTIFCCLPFSLLAEDVEILMMLSDGYGPNTYHIIDDYEIYGWHLTTSALSESVTPCGAYQELPDLVVDQNLSALADFSAYDALIIANVAWTTGNPYNDILSNLQLMKKIGKITQTGPILYAACAGPRILAAANLLTNVHITGQTGNNNQFLNEYTTAGAIFEGEGHFPVIDNNIITNVRGQYYHKFNSEAIMEVMGRRSVASCSKTFNTASVTMSSTSQLVDEDILWDKTFGGASADGAKSVIETNDGGLLICGYTYSAGEGHSDVLLLKTDANGNKTWIKTYGSQCFEYGNSAIQTSDGGYLITGFTTASDNGAQDALLIKTDTSGNQEWIKFLGDSMNDEFKSAIEIDGNFYALGHTEQAGAGESDIYLVKFSSDGTVIWEKKYGGTKSEMGTELHVNSQGNLIMVGAEGSTTANMDFYLLEVDKDGNSLWSRHYGSPGAFPFDWAHSGTATKDGGYLLLGDSNVSTVCNLLLIKTDSLGNRIWDQNYGEILHDHGYSVKEMSNGDILMCGALRPDGSYKNNFYILRSDSTGNELWSRNFGGESNDAATSIIQTSDGNYLAVGYTDSYGAGSYDIWMMKISAFLPNFKNSPKTGHAPLDIQFDDCSTGGIEKWAWDFDNDGTTDSEVASPKWTYRNPGNYSVSLEISGGARNKNICLVDAVRVFDGRSALQFDGTDSYVQAPASGSLNITGAFTIEAWIYPTGWGENQIGRIVDKKEMFVQVVGVNSVVNNNSLALQIYHSDDSFCNVSTGENSIKLNEWQHISVSYNGSNLVSMTINGAGQKVTIAYPASGQIKDNSEYDLFIGNNQYSNATFNGFIDDVRIWDYKRSTTDIAANQEIYPDGNQSGLLAYWPMDEGNGKYLYDKTSNANNAEISDVIWDQGAPMEKISGIHSNTALASDYTLLAIYPNPFNATTTINYTLSKDTNAEISIYDITGCHVITLFKQKQSAGSYSVHWNGTNDAHDPIASGIYFCTLQTENDIFSEKIVLLK